MSNTVEGTKAVKLEDQKVVTNIGEIVKIILFVLAGAGAWWNLKSDVKDYAATNNLNNKVAELRMNAIELRLTQIEAWQAEQDKRRELEIQERLKSRHENNSK